MDGGAQGKGREKVRMIHHSTFFFFVSGTVTSATPQLAIQHRIALDLYGVGVFYIFFLCLTSLNPHAALL